MKEKAILFGASNLGKLTYEYIKNKYNVLFFCDNDKRKWDTVFCNLEIQNPEILRKEEYKHIKIIISSIYVNEIYNQLIQYSINEENIKLSEFNIKKILQMQYEEKQCKNFKNIIDNFHQDKNFNLHIMIDNFYCKRFIEFVNQYFNPLEHKFVVLSNFENGLKYVDNIEEYDNAEVLYYNEYTELNLYFYVKSSKKLFIHYLTDYICKFIYDYKVWNETELNWIVWGGDFYTYIDYELYNIDTKNYLDQINYNSSIFIKNKLNYKNLRINVIEKIHYILPPIKGDYDLLKKHFKTNGKYRRFCYPNVIQYDMNTIEVNHCNREKYNFLLGNSGDPSNNHLEVMYKLKNLECDNFQVFCPLSYGNQEYITNIIKTGKSILGDKFIPITNFLDPNKYLSFLNEIDVVFMNHNRQQALGNIWALLYLGKKIYIKKEISTYKSFNELGIKLFDIKAINNMCIEDIIYIDDKIVTKNKELLIQNFGDEQIKKNLISIFGG